MLVKGARGIFRSVTNVIIRQWITVRWFYRISTQCLQLNVNQFYKDVQSSAIIENQPLHNEVTDYKNTL